MWFVKSLGVAETSSQIGQMYFISDLWFKLFDVSGLAEEDDDDDELDVDDNDEDIWF